MITAEEARNISLSYKEKESIFKTISKNKLFDRICRLSQNINSKINDAAERGKREYTLNFSRPLFLTYEETVNLIAENFKFLEDLGYMLSIDFVPLPPSIIIRLHIEW